MPDGEPEALLGTNHFGVLIGREELGFAEGCDVAMEELTLAYERLELE